MKYELDDCVSLAAANAELQKEVKWEKLFQKEMLEDLRQYCFAHNTELEYVLVPFFAMSSAITGKMTSVQSGLLRKGRSNLYLLVAGNPASGKSCGFELAVNKPKIAIEQALGVSLITSELSRTALLKRLQLQTDDNQPFLILASDEMGLHLKGESKDTKEWEIKRSIYNNSFSGSDILSERMIGSKKINKVTIQNPHLSIIGMTQLKPLFEWIKNVSSNDDGLLDRYLIWVVTENSQTLIPDHIKLPADWPTQCLLAVANYHSSNPNKQYVISPDVYKSIHKLEQQITLIHKQQWIEYKQLVEQGKEDEAILFNRRKPRIPVARFSELVIRFAMGIHIGFFAMNKILNGLALGDIPTDIPKTTVDFAIAAVQRCLNQVHDFRIAASKVSSKQTNSVKDSLLDDNMLTRKNKQEAYLNTTESSRKQNEESTGPSFSKSQKAPTEGCLLRKIATFPAPFFVPKAIYRFTKGSVASDVQRLFNLVSQGVCGSKGYLGNLVKVKIKPHSKQSYLVLFRAPYDKVDKELLKEHNISNKKQYSIIKFDRKMVTAK